MKPSSPVLPDLSRPQRRMAEPRTAFPRTRRRTRSQQRPAAFPALRQNWIGMAIVAGSAALTIGGLVVFSGIRDSQALRSPVPAALQP